MADFVPLDKDEFDDFFQTVTRTPYRHDCGTVLSDWKGGNWEVTKTCGWGHCTQYFCPGCGRNTGGFGPVGCHCEASSNGHGTYAEYPRPSLARLRKTRKPRNRRWRS